jgi:hypothetical protein
MTEASETTGTPTQEVGDAADQQTTGTPAQDGRDAREAENIAKLNLEWKAKAERVNELERKLAELENQRSQSPAATQATDPRLDRFGRVKQFADQNDPVAQELLELRQEFAELVSGVTVKSEIDAIRDDAEREEVRKHYLDNRHRLDVKAARAEVRERKLSAEMDELRKKLAATVNSQSIKGTVSTSDRETPSSDIKPKVMTGAEFDDLVRRVGDEQGFNAVRRLRQDLMAGRIVTKG